MAKIRKLNDPVVLEHIFDQVSYFDQLISDLMELQPETEGRDHDTFDELISRTIKLVKDFYRATGNRADTEEIIEWATRPVTR